MERGVVEHNHFNSLNFSTVDPMLKIFWFSESLERDLQMTCFHSNFRQGPNLSFFGLGPWAIYYPWYRQIGKILLSLKYDFWWHHLNFFLSFQKIIKNLTLVMAAERIAEPLMEGGCSWTSFNSLNFSTIDPMLKIFWFSESLERDLSNDVFQSNILSGP